MSLSTGTTQLLRYATVGITLNGLGYLLYLSLTTIGFTPYSVVTVLYPLSVMLSFYFNGKWSFDYSGKLAGRFSRFLFAHLFGYLLNIGLLFVFSEHLGLPHQVVQAVAIFIVAAFLFLALRFFVYPAPPQNEPST